MYAWMFRHLPGPLWLRILTSVALTAAVVVVLVEFGFPWFAHVINLENATVGG